MVSDVPVGIFLSGGIDSNLLCSILNQKYDFKSFTIGFKDNILDESHIAQKTSKHLNIENITLDCSFSDFSRNFELMYNYFDEPFGDSSVPLTMMVSKLAAEHVKVSLSADGGDELFGGYTKYYSSNFMYKLLLSYPKFISPLTSSILKYINNNLEFKKSNLFEMAQRLISRNNVYHKRVSKIESSILTDLEIKNIFINSNLEVNEYFYDNIQNNIDLSVIETLMLHDIKHYMKNDILKKVDMSTMAFSLEGREPFLDYELYDWIGRIPLNQKVNYKTNKPLLKNIVYKYLPKEMIDLPKKGFGAPLHLWVPKLIHKNKDLILDNVNDMNLNSSYINKMFKKDNMSKFESNKLWILLNLFKWLEKHKIGIDKIC
tara:strand:- start:30 stop:1151 length:1122 start_codon:yes stop_codon:yes gene_type:complete